MSLSVDGKKFKAHVPAGVKDGQKIKLAGKGKLGINGGKAGDLYLHVTVKPDATFSMRGHDIVMDLPVTVGQAVAGGKVEAKDIDGNPVTFKVPAGSSSGAEVKLTGLGVQRRSAVCRSWSPPSRVWPSSTPPKNSTKKPATISACNQEVNNGAVSQPDEAVIRDVRNRARDGQGRSRRSR